MELKTLDRVVIKFAGDSGDGMQLTGGFTNNTALLGADLQTFPDFPAGSGRPQVLPWPVYRAFSFTLAATDLYPGDQCDVLIDHERCCPQGEYQKKPRTGAIVIVNTDGFGQQNLRLAHYDESRWTIIRWTVISSSA